MPYLNTPAGTSILVPDGMSYAAALKKAQAQFPQDFGIKPQEGIGAALGKGWEQLKSSTETGLGSLFGKPKPFLFLWCQRNLPWLVHVNLLLLYFVFFYYYKT